jgi:hypothetical protein
MNVNNRLIIIFILAFASIADVVVVLTLGEGFLYMINVFLVLFFVFALQDAFKWFRIIVIIYLAARVVLWLVPLVAGFDLLYARQFIENQILHPALMPLYFSMLLIAVFSYRFVRSYDIFK